jgi:hypothetical protein
VVLVCRVASLVIGVILSPALEAPTYNPQSIWSTTNGHGFVAIERCDEALYGRILGADRASIEPMGDCASPAFAVRTVIRCRIPPADTYVLDAGATTTEPAGSAISTRFVTATMSPHNSPVTE